MKRNKEDFEILRNILFLKSISIYKLEHFILILQINQLIIQETCAEATKVLCNGKGWKKSILILLSKEILFQMRTLNLGMSILFTFSKDMKYILMSMFILKVFFHVYVVYYNIFFFMSKRYLP